MGTTARPNQIDEDSITNFGSNDGVRVNAGSGADNPTAIYTSWGGGSAGSIATYEAAVRGGVLRHDQTNYSTGYLPVGQIILQVEVEHNTIKFYLSNNSFHHLKL